MKKQLSGTGRILSMDLNCWNDIVIKWLVMAEKYQPLLDNIYAGLGIPASAVGDSTSVASCNAMEYMIRNESYLYGYGRSIGGDEV